MAIGGDVGYPESGRFSHLAVVVSGILQSPHRTVSAVFGVVLIIFSAAMLLIPLQAGWLVVSATVPMTFVCGIVALHLAAHWGGA